MTTPTDRAARLAELRQQVNMYRGGLCNGVVKLADDAMGFIDEMAQENEKAERELAAIRFHLISDLANARIGAALREPKHWPIVRNALLAETIGGSALVRSRARTTLDALAPLIEQEGK